MKTIWTLATAGVLAAAAWGADCVVEPAPAADLTAGSPGRDGTLELKWDNGISAWLISHYTGMGTWVGNDFDISTLSGYRAVESMRVYSGPSWPNGRWDGFRLGIYSFTSVPGSLLWGPKFVVGSGSSNAWRDFSVNWTLPAGTDAFVAAVEQYYDYPNNDPHVVDNNRVFLRHSWLYEGGTWGPNTNSTGYYNLMVRVIVNDSTVAVEPASLGAVKSLFY